MGIMLQGRQRLNQPSAPLVNEKRWRGSAASEADVRLAEACQDFRPPIDAIRVRTTQRNPMLRILRGNRRAVALPREHIRTSHESFQMTWLHTMPAEHRLDR